MCTSGPGSGDVTDIPLMSAVLLLQGGPLLPLLHPGPSPAYGGCSSSACGVNAARGQLGWGSGKAEHPRAGQGSGRGSAAEPESRGRVTDHSMGSWCLSDTGCPHCGQASPGQRSRAPVRASCSLPQPRPGPGPHPKRPNTFCGPALAPRAPHREGSTPSCTATSPGPIPVAAGSSVPGPGLP